jgi:hypothetical protein
MSATMAVHNLQRLTQFYKAGYQNRFLDSALHKVVSHQIQRDEADLERVEAVLADFERQYSLTSDEFWARYQAGQMSDDADLVEWIAFCRMRRRLVERLRILRGDGTDA